MKPRRPHFGGFTLTELIVVLVIIVILITIGAAGWNLLVGSSSVEAAQNITSAFLSRTREEALAHRKARGVIFFARDEQMFMAAVYHDDPTGRPAQIETVPESDLEPIPTGVHVRFINNGTPRYIMPGVILFDSYGQVSIKPYTIRPDGNLGKLMRLDPAVPDTTPRFSSLGITLYEFQRYARIPEAERDKWLDQKGRSLFVNRYSGTLVQGRAQ